MRIFLALCSLAILANAKPQGYNYGISTGGQTGQTIGLNTFSTTFGLNELSKTSGFGSLANANGNAIGASSVQNTFKEAPLVHKQFFTISAPEDRDDLERTKHLIIGRPQKNYRVVFIKAPSSSQSNVKLSAEYAPKEEKTVIYVLSKKDNQLEVNDIATPAPTVPSKPEVFFIKYKTEEEAQHAQQQIQAEYDKIEGTSEHNDGGVAPQQSVIGILDGGNAAAVASKNSFGGIATFTNTNIGTTSTATAIGTSGVSTFGLPTNTRPISYLPPQH